MTQPKVPGANLAVGYWGRNGSSHIAALQTAQKVLAFNRDKIFAMGLPFRVWSRLLTASEPRSIQCTCFRDTTQQSDTQCLQCYGMRFQPGYLKFGFRTTFYSAAHTDLTLTGITKATGNTPYRLQLADGEVSGTITTPSYTISDLSYGPWEYHVDAPLRVPTNTVTTEFMVNNTTWVNISQLSSILPALNSTIQFRVTLTRAATSDKSPLFEILRARFACVPSVRPADVNPGEILLLKTWDVDKFVRDPMGKSTQSQGEKYWTLPLNFFNNTLAPESASTILGVDHFLEDARGPEAGVRYVSTQHSYSRTFKMFTRQEMMMRRIAGEIGDAKLGESLQKVF